MKTSAKYKLLTPFVAGVFAVAVVTLAPFGLAHAADPEPAHQDADKAHAQAKDSHKTAMKSKSKEHHASAAKAHRHASDKHAKAADMHDKAAAVVATPASTTTPAITQPK
jgi:ABC-type nickel/cobalt efflux system permease component RcnA